MHTSRKWKDRPPLRATRGAGIASAVLGSLLLVATGAAAAPSDDDAAALKRAAERGDRLYALDQAAWVTTDEMLRKVPNPAASGIKGWIVEEQGDRLHVIYYHPDGDSFKATFIADARGRTVLDSHRLAPGEDASLTPLEISMIRAREVAKRQSVAPCTAGAMNTVVLPPASPADPIAVYIMSAQVKTGEYPLGGHHEFDIGPDGRIVASRKFTNSCLNLTPAAQSPDKTTMALMVTHLLDPTPTEIHVFMSRTIGLPIYVGTSISRSGSPMQKVWQVDGDQITLVRGGVEDPSADVPRGKSTPAHF